MDTTTDNSLYPIGDVARRTSMSVSAIRFYSDEGIVPPTQVTHAGHRLYDVQAIASLEFVRTLRDLGTGLEQIRQLLAGETSLRYLLAEHLDVVERQEPELRLRRAVLRALVRQEDASERISLMQKLVRMPDAEREQLIDDFWREVSVDLTEENAQRLRDVPPRLSDDPTVEQLEAWITLAELLQDEEFRSNTRSYLYETYATGAGAMVSAPAVQEFIGSTGTDVIPKLMAAHASGLSPADAHATDLASGFVRETARALGRTVDDEVRGLLARGYERIETTTQNAIHDPDYLATHGRYLALVATINGSPHPDAHLDAAVQADPRIPQSGDIASFGKWLAAAIRATGDSV